MINKNEEIIGLAKLLKEIGDHSEILRIVNQKIYDWMKSDVELITMLNPITRNTIRTIGRNEKSRRQFGKYHNINNVITGWVIKNRKSFLSNDLKKDEIFNLFNKDRSMFSTALCSPIMFSGKIIGTILMMNQDPEKIFTDNDRGFLENLTAVIAPYVYDYQSIQDYFTYPYSEQNLIAKYSKIGLIGRSNEFVSLLRSIETASRCNSRVLLEGETGTGKEIIARAIHNFSDRSDRRFVVLDCSALASQLIESEMFGHVRGAFTGAITERKGIVEEAHGGTLFIDEINLLTFDLQAKLLRFIQESEYRKVGTNEVSKVNVRIISATSSSLYDLVKTNKFRAELYYRLNIYPINVPTLNERSIDIPILVKHFISKFSNLQSKNIEYLDENIMFLLINRKWAGNIRELENFVERLVAIADDKMKVLPEKILPDQYKKELRKIKSAESIDIEINSLEESLQNYEEILLRNALLKCSWNQFKAAEYLGLKEQTLRYKMNKYKIVRPK